MKTFGEGLDIKAREVGGWPSGAVVHTVSVMGEGDDPQVLLTGAVPIGVKKNGFPKWGTQKQCPSFQAVIRLSEYRLAIAKDDQFPVADLSRAECHTVKGAALVTSAALSAGGRDSFLRRAVLLVSVLADSNEGTVELMAGDTVQVSDIHEGDQTLCVLRDGREVFIEQRYMN